MAKRQVKNKKPSQKWKKYEVVGTQIKKARTCPRCSDVFLAIHKDRVYCGQCHYTEFLSKQEPKIIKLKKEELGLATELNKEEVEKVTKKILEKK